MVVIGEVCGLLWAPYGLGGGGGGLAPESEETGADFAGGVAISGGSGGTGGGIKVGCRVLSGTLRCCLEITGGSFANTSRKIAKKSRMFDFCVKDLAPLMTIAIL
jgi:hypothetical protein